MDMETVWQNHSGPIHRFIVSRTRPPLDPDDLVQEVFLRAVSEKQNLRNPHAVSSWMFTIARNVITDAYRKAQRTELHENMEFFPADSSFTPEDLPGDDFRSLVRCIHPMLEKLEEPYRQAVYLNEIEGRTQAEIAAASGISVSGVKSRVQRGRQQLHSLIQACCRTRRGPGGLRLTEDVISCTC